MTRGQFHRALAKATGESIRTLKQFGFSLLEPDVDQLDADGPDDDPQTVDWDRVEADRVSRAVQV